MSETQDHNRESDDVQEPDGQAQTDNAVEIQSPEKVRRTPTIRPTLVWLVITILGLITSISVIISNQQSFGGQSTAEIAIQIVSVIGILIIIRLAIRIFILTRTTYELDGQRVRRKYSLLMRTMEQEVPIEMIRSSRLKQNRVQNLMGYGDIEINEDLGAIKLENVNNPHEIQSTISSYREEILNSERTSSNH